MPKTIDDQLQKLLTTHINLDGRRVINAGNARGLQDYITKIDLRNPSIEAIYTPNGILLFTFTDTSILASLDIQVPDEAYGSGWNASLKVPTKNAVYDKIESIIVEGTFTPTISFAGASVGVTYSVQKGIYQKIGNWIKFNIYVLLTSKGSSVGALTVDGLPFSTENIANQFVTVTVWGNNLAAITGGLEAHINPNNAKVNIGQIVLSAFSQLADGNLTDTSDFMLSGHYKVA